jgi:hypothetical protein
MLFITPQIKLIASTVSPIHLLLQMRFSSIQFVFSLLFLWIA